MARLTGPCVRRAGALQGGAAFIAVLLFIAIFGAISAGVVAAGSAVAQRTVEEDLLFVGAQFRNAIRSYYEAGVGGRRYAMNFDELLRDKRVPGVLRHLRRVYPDPLTGSEDWGVVRAPEGGIMGVFSKSKGTPLKIDGFDPQFAAFKGKTKYSDWVFAYVPQAVVQPGTSIGQSPGAQGAAAAAASASGAATPGNAAATPGSVAVTPAGAPATPAK